MKQKLWFSLVIFLPYCIDKELYKAIDYLREQVRVLVERQEKEDKRIRLTILIPLGLAYICYRLWSRYRSWVSRSIIVYLTWLVLALMGGYLISASLGGTSMAVVDGVVERRDLIGQEIIFSGWIWLLAQICIIPWICISVLIMIRNESKFFINSC